MSKWQQLTERYQTLTLRERLLILLSGLVVFLIGGYSLFVEPSYLQLKKSQANIVKAQTEQSALQAQVAAIHSRLRGDMNKILRDEIAAHEQAIAKLDEKLGSQITDLVPAPRMAAVLEQLLAQGKGVKLLGLTSMAPKPMLDLVDDSGKNINLYQHGIRLRLAGRYFDLLRFIDAVEALPTRFYWQRFDYRVDQYPTAELEIDLFTLSTSQTFMGS